MVPWVEVYLGRDYELYVTPLPDGELLVAGLADAAQLAGGAVPAFERWLAEQPALAARLVGAVPLTPLQGRAPLAARATAGYVPGCVLLGDAAGYVDPITGGGITQALLTAELLAAHTPAILAEDAALAAFDHERGAMLRDYHLLTRGVLALARQHSLAPFALRALRVAPPLFSHLIGVAGGTRHLLPGLPAPRHAPAPAREPTAHDRLDADARRAPRDAA
jgi:flavin-dependent dehydrogenase